MNAIVSRVACVLLACFVSGIGVARAGTAFSYQGELYNAGAPVNANYDFRFILYTADVGGTQIGAISQVLNVPVVQGVFTATVDFGQVFSGGRDEFIEIAARPSGGGAYAILSPRQPVLGTPRAQSLAMPYFDYLQSSQPGIGIFNAGDGAAGDFRSQSDFVAMYVGNSGTGGGLRVDTDDSGDRTAISAYNYGVDRSAVDAQIVTPTNDNTAVYARTSGDGLAGDFEINSATSTGDALFARTTSTQTQSQAGYFSGPVIVQCPGGTCNTPLALQVLGTMSKSSGTFRIDHPLDPENKFLSHSFVESPDMKNIYDGTVVLDGSGAATVELPDWFEALNRDFRYLLTAIGAPSPNLYVSREVAGNAFAIAGGTPNAKVSWQVTGIRHDAYAKAHPTPVEEDKSPDERGRYLTPDAFGKSADRAIYGRDHPPLREAAPPPRE